MRYAFLTSNAKTLVNFRFELIKKIISLGHDVLAIAPDHDCTSKEKLLKIGALPIDCKLNRNSTNPVIDFFNLVQLIFLLKKLKIDSILTYTIKPVIYGGIAGFISGIPRRIAMIEGLGFVYTTNEINRKSKKFLKFFTTFLYKISIKRQHKVIFLNQDDIDEFISMGIVEQHKVFKLGGIGVDLAFWKNNKIRKHPFTFTMVSRILKEKGVIEFFKASQVLKKKYPNVLFKIVGDIDSNPTSLSKNEIMNWVKCGVDWTGPQDNIKKILLNTSVFVLPSYREGVPRSSQEALSMSLPIITTNVPGCKDTVIDGLNGFLIEPRDVEGLVSKMEKFIKQPTLVKKMGKNSRSIAENRYDVHVANDKIYCLMSESF